MTGDIFQLYLETPGLPRLLLSARRRKKSAVPTFVIAQAGEHSQGTADLKTRSSSKIFAVVRGNRAGTVYKCAVLRAQPAEEATAPASPLRHMPNATMQLANCSKSAEARELELAGGEDVHVATIEAEQEVAAVRFKQAGVSKVGGVRELMVVIPDPRPPPRVLIGTRSPYLLDRYDASIPRKGPRMHGLFVAHSIKPQYHKESRGYVLDFKGRVRQGSPKNCQLAADSTCAGVGPSDSAGGVAASEPVYMFGKYGNDKYIMDFAYPMNLLQAFTIAIACFDTRSFAS
jgi:hypothetical protein